jgi:hypothetical protein
VYFYEGVLPLLSQSSGGDRLSKIKVEMDNGPDLVFEGILLGETPAPKDYDRYNQIRIYSASSGKIVIVVHKVEQGAIIRSTGHMLHNWSDMIELLDDPGSGIRWSAKFKKLLRDVALVDPGASVVLERQV